MGHHYVPQAYLQGFEDPTRPGRIWMYDKVDRRFSSPPVKSVAQASRYYSEENERDLNRLVEAPANAVLRKLRGGGKLIPADRATLELYVGTMLMRVPRRRRKAWELVPQVAMDTFDDVSRELAEYVEQTSADSNVVAHLFTELERLRAEYQSTPPPGVAERIRDPWPSQRILAAIRPMTWRIISSGGANRFLTSDNPAYFFESDGLAGPKSELTFPLSGDLALLASWQGTPGDTIFLRARSALVKEVNRRVASGAERFVFYHEPAMWVAKLADKARPFISRIEWAG